MNEEFYHAFYSETYHNNPRGLIIYGETIGPNPIKKEVSYFIGAGNYSDRLLSNEAVKETLKHNKDWAKDTVYIGVVRLLDRRNYMIREHLILKYMTFCGYTEGEEHNTTT